VDQTCRHIGVAPNKGDTNVPTWPQDDEYAGRLKNIIQKM